MSDLPVIGPEEREKRERGKGESGQPERDPRERDPRERDQRTRPLLRTMLGKVLRRTRLEQGRTLADVARAAQVSMPYLSEIERGRKEASSEVLAAVCDALRIDLPDVLAEVRRDLVAARPRRARILQLDSFRARRAQPGPQSPSAGDVTLLAA